MTIRKSKTERLNYIEETPKHRSKLRQVAITSVRNKIQSAMDHGLFITYSNGSQIVREYPDGKIEVVGQLNSQPKKVEQGSKFTLSTGA